MSAPQILRIDRHPLWLGVVLREPDPPGPRAKNKCNGGARALCWLSPCFANAVASIRSKRRSHAPFLRSCLRAAPTGSGGILNGNVSRQAGRRSRRALAAQTQLPESHALAQPAALEPRIYPFAGMTLPLRTLHFETARHHRFADLKSGFRLAQNAPTAHLAPLTIH